MSIPESPKKAFGKLFLITILIALGICFLAAGVYIAVNPHNYVLLQEGKPLNLLTIAVGPIFIIVAAWLSKVKKWLKILTTALASGITVVSLFIVAAVFFATSSDKPARSVAISPDNAWELFVSSAGDSFDSAGGAAYLQSREGIFSQRVELRCSRIDGSVSLETARFIDNRTVELLTSGGQWLISFDPQTAMSHGASNHDHCATNTAPAN